MGSASKILLVDDEPGILLTTSAILHRRGYEVTAAADVPSALKAIAEHKFNLLIADLNIGQPGDGFTIVSALRRTQPEAKAIIVTGFPAFDAALESIRRQVDKYAVKPVPISDLMEMIESTLQENAHPSPAQTLRTSEIVLRDEQLLIQRWLARVRQGPELPESISDQALIDHLPGVVEELCRRVVSSSATTTPEAIGSAESHGKLRRTQGVPLQFVLQESRILRQEILTLVHENLLSINLSFVFSDLRTMSDSLDEQLQVSVNAFMNG